MPIEIERKFLVDAAGWRNAMKRIRPKGVEYLQGYLYISEQKTARVRVMEGKSRLTIKGSLDNRTRLEFEYDIPLEDALTMLRTVCIQPVIRKTRYTLHYEDNNFWEVDEFHDENEGLILAEMELMHPDQFLIRPSWIGEEVTDDERYYNARLVLHPYNTWK